MAGLVCIDIDKYIHAYYTVSATTVYLIKKSTPVRTATGTGELSATGTGTGIASAILSD